ncbi:MAG: DNA polymerase III subunit alpha [Zetaproteobacteria bacterium CG02_land_8_20_14_3_00_50_9]|nr:MAG: DNA polymerase III subunit alpha [Zetaproteobacteria bacterium CG02_land_8_20_14_3_00_50_9]PIY56355.1 MAG: DNA polymerase III subunit alpha [Zetaproteobacteria bacterium CG_4_10_14_0_8_um_filter_49_80]
MLKPSFVHLHTHTDFSLLAAVMSVRGMVEQAAKDQQPAIALTDYGNLFGAIEFYNQALKHGIKPIMGCTFFLCDDHLKRVSAGPRGPQYAQIVLLARNNTGWKNLLKLVSISYLDGFYYKPRIDCELLKRYGQGIIALSGGSNGDIERAMQKGNVEQAASLARQYRDIFEPDSFFIELQRHNNPAEDELNHKMIALAYEEQIPLVAANDAHFLKHDDVDALEAMLALQSNRTLDDMKGGQITQDYALKSTADMVALFEDVPEAIENTLYIAESCNVDLQFGQYQLPDFQPPVGLTLQQFMRQESHNGLADRWPAILLGTPDADRNIYEKRLDFELDVIENMGFPGYFLIVSDFIGWAKEQQIPVGPGRGSGAGSLVAYCLLITDLDPIRYGLLFERFLNPERISMPDFDIDFCMSRRDEVIRYVTNKYGEDKVAQIITYGSMKAKAVVRDVGRVMGMDIGKVNQIAKLIPNDLKMTLLKALEQEPKLKAMEKEDDEVNRLFQLAHKLEGKHRNAGKHAAGVIISKDALTDTAPLFKVAGEDSKVVQWDMGNVEKVGLIKFDFLGLKTLTVIDLACRLIRSHATSDAAKHFKIETIPLVDTPTFDLLQRGQTSAVFQVESSGMRNLLTRLKPDCFEDIIALVALYRPGPLESGMVDTYIKCKHGEQEIAYLLPQLKPILQETNGVILYQEQVMQIAQVLAGYTLGQADMLRRAMGKKKPEEMQQQRDIFMDGAKKQGIDLLKAEQIFDLMEKFAGYGFNKSHSAAYALIAYQTAYLKAHFPQAFMAATMSCDMGNADKVCTLVADCRAMDLAILAPDINASDWEFVPESNAIRFGLGAIKGVGEAIIRTIVHERAERGLFESFEDMVIRLPERTLNKRVTEALIKAGALKSLVPNQHAALLGLSDALEESVRRRKEQLSPQSVLFGGVAAQTQSKPLFPDLPMWSEGEALQHERDVLGFFLSGNPLQEKIFFAKDLGNTDIAHLKMLEQDASVVLPASISGIREHRGKRGTMAFLQIDDLSGSCELICFSKLYAECRDQIHSERPLLIAATLDRSKDEPVLLAERVILLDEVLPELVGRVDISCSEDCLNSSTLEAMTHWLAQTNLEMEQPVKAPAWRFDIRLDNGSIARMERAQAPVWTPDFHLWLQQTFGKNDVHVQCRSWKV